MSVAVQMLKMYINVGTAGILMKVFFFFFFMLGQNENLYKVSFVELLFAVFMLKIYIYTHKYIANSNKTVTSYGKSIVGT